MGLEERVWERRYKTRKDPNHLVQEFLEPAIGLSKSIFRGVGYFSSSTFNGVGETLGGFVGEGGKIWMVTNVVYSESDKIAV